MEEQLTKQAFPTYPAYVDSGIEWLGKIPEGWGVKRFKFVAKYQKGRLPKKIVSTWKEGLLPYMSMDYLRGGIDNQWVLDKDMEGVEQDEILLLWDGSNSGEFIKSRKGVISSTLALVKFHSITKEFAWYYSLKIEQKLRQETIGMGIPHVNGKDLNSTIVLLPPLAEQTAIAQFLDEKTAKIDQAIAQKEKMIELLKERKQIMIQQAVTKGLNPDVPMIDSGVDWIGEIPEHWEIISLKRGCKKITDGAHISPELGTEYRPFISTVNIDHNGLIDFENCIYTTEKCYEYLVRTGCKPKLFDVLFSKDGTVGRTSIVKDERDFVIASSLVLLRPNLDLFVPEFLDLVLSSNHVKIQTDGLLSGSALRRISIAKVTNLLVFKLSINEQNQILKYSKRIISDTSKSISLQQTQIEKLKEYKATLIDSAVTGKIKIC